MKKLIILLFFGAMTFSCSSDDSSGSSLSDTPDAKAQYDDSSFGIYKGVFVGSSGTILIDVYNSETATATLTINGSSKTYTATEKVAEDFAIDGLTFTNGSSSFDFSVSGAGGYPYVDNISISGHPNAAIGVFKEYSNQLVKCYQGSFSGDDSGTLNIAIRGDEIVGLAKSNSEDYSLSLGGIVSGNNIGGTFEGGTFVGTSNGNRISGTWSNDFSESGNWSATRKL